LTIATAAEAIDGRPYSVRTYLIAIVIAVLIPALLVGGWLASRSAAAERVQVERNLDQKTREILANINREIIAAKSVLSSLATSPSLQSGKLIKFHRQAQAVARQLDIQIVLRDLNADEQLVNSAMPWEAPRLKGAPAEIREADADLLHSENVEVTNLFFGRAAAEPIVAVRMAVKRKGIPTYGLGVSIPAQKFAAILQDAHVCEQCLASIVDRKNVVVARSVRHGEFVGKPLLVGIPDNGAAAGVNTGVNREGIAYHWVWRRSEATGWIVSIGVPEAVLNAPSKIELASYSAAGGLLLVAAIALSYGAGGRLSRAFGVLGIDRQPTHEEFRVLFESAPNGVLLVDDGGRIMLLNRQVETTFGYARGELLGKTVEMLIPERFRSAHIKDKTSYTFAPTARPMGTADDLWGLRKDGTEFPIEVSLNPIKTSAANLVIATVFDITLRKQAAKRLSIALAERDHLRRRLMQAQEDERLRLARELHDQTGQSLTAAMLELKNIENLVDEKDKDQLRLLSLQLEQMGKALHQVAWELRPASIDELGLSSALENYLAEWGAQFGIEVDFHCCDTNLAGLPNDGRTTIYRIVQEGLTNIAKHASGATSVSVVIEIVDAKVHLMIEDNGCGFDIAGHEAQRSDRGGLGLAGMRERVSLVGGELEVESSVGVSTTIFARIPLGGERTAA